MLPRGFWVPDGANKIHAVDFAFMSTSTDNTVSLDHYLGNDQVGVLWEIQCMEEDDIGFHSPADVQLLSQHPDDRELLFPPLTMLEFSMNDAAPDSPKGQFQRDPSTDEAFPTSDLIPNQFRHLVPVRKTANGARYVHLKVKATFT